MLDMHSTVQFKKEIDGRLYLFIMPANAPVGEAYDVLFEGLSSVLAIANKNVEKMVRTEAQKEVESDQE
jgi:hypothetical protein